MLERRWNAELQVNGIQDIIVVIVSKKIWTNVYGPIGL